MATIDFEQALENFRNSEPNRNARIAEIARHEREAQALKDSIAQDWQKLLEALTQERRKRLADRSLGLCSFSHPNPPLALPLDQLRYIYQEGWLEEEQETAWERFHFASKVVNSGDGDLLHVCSRHSSSWFLKGGIDVRIYDSLAAGFRSNVVEENGHLFTTFNGRKDVTDVEVRTPSLVPDGLHEFLGLPPLPGKSPSINVVGLSKIGQIYHSM